MDLLETLLPKGTWADWAGTYDTNAGDDYVFLAGFDDSIDW
jgi:hypothetical protein